MLGDVAAAVDSFDDILKRVVVGKISSKSIHHFFLNVKA